MVAKSAVEVNVAPPPLNEPDVAQSEFVVNTVSLRIGAAKAEAPVTTQIRKQTMSCNKVCLVFSLFAPGL